MPSLDYVFPICIKKHPLGTQLHTRVRSHPLKKKNSINTILVRWLIVSLCQIFLKNYPKTHNHITIKCSQIKYYRFSWSDDNPDMRHLATDTGRRRGSGGWGGNVNQLNYTNIIQTLELHQNNEGYLSRHETEPLERPNTRRQGSPSALKGEKCANGALAHSRHSFVAPTRCWGGIGKSGIGVNQSIALGSKRILLGSRVKVFPMTCC